MSHYDLLHFFVTRVYRGIYSIDRWRQMPPGKSWGKWKIENWGKIFLDGKLPKIPKYA